MQNQYLLIYYVPVCAQDTNSSSVQDDFIVYRHTAGHTI